MDCLQEQQSQNGKFIGTYIAGVDGLAYHLSIVLMNIRMLASTNQLPVF